MSNVIPLKLPLNLDQPGLLKLVVQPRGAIETTVLIDGEVPHLRNAATDCARILKKDLVEERKRFETYIGSIMDQMVEKGVTISGWEPGQDMFWRREDGRYGVETLNSVWQGWMAALSIPTGVVPKKG